MLGTPSDDTWPGVTELSHYRRYRFKCYRCKRLGAVFPRLTDIPHAESLATSLLQVNHFNSFIRKCYDAPIDTIGGRAIGFDYL